MPVSASVYAAPAVPMILWNQPEGLEANGMVCALPWIFVMVVPNPDADVISCCPLAGKLPFRINVAFPALVME